MRRRNTAANLFNRGISLGSSYKSRPQYREDLDQNNNCTSDRASNLDYRVDLQSTGAVRLINFAQEVYLISATIGVLVFLLSRLVTEG